jgi:hypothetical protein
MRKPTAGWRLSSVRRPATGRQGWRLLSLPRHAIAWVIGIDVLAATVPWLFRARITRSELGVALLLTTLSIAYSLSVVTFERVRVLLAKGTSPDMCPNLLGTWTFAAAVMLPMRLAAVVVVIAVVADWPARNVARQTDVYRYVYSSAAAMLAAAAANLALGSGLPYLAGLTCAGVAYIAVGAGLIAMAMVSVGQFAGLRIFVTPRTYAIEVKTIALGMGEAVAQVLHLPLVVLSLPIAIAIQQRSGRAALKQASELPEPMPETVWRHVAAGLLAGCKLVGVIRVDSDKPAVLRALTELQSPCDAVGLYRGGLAILLIDCPASHADALAVRLRMVLAATAPDARVAVAAAPNDGRSLAELLVVTEAELSVESADRQARAEYREE